MRMFILNDFIILNFSDLYEAMKYFHTFIGGIKLLSICCLFVIVAGKITLQLASSNKQRSQLSIFTNILKLTKKSIYRTRIMTQAEMNHSQAQKYLTFLQTEGLIEEVPKQGKRESNKLAKLPFRITEKGLLFLGNFERWASDEDLKGLMGKDRLD